jgi:hypothetical protein
MLSILVRILRFQYLDQVREAEAKPLGINTLKSGLELTLTSGDGWNDTARSLQ